MKIDKDALLKQHFWILVVLTIPLALVAILLLVTSVSSAITKARKDLSNSLTEVNGIKEIKTPEEKLKLEAEAKVLIDNETTAWDKAFKEQESLLRWPRLVEAKYEISTGLFANDVEVLKQPADKGAWPADVPKDGLMHGILQKATDAILEITDHNGKQQTFHVTPRLIGREVTDKEDEKGGTFPFQQLNQHLKKFVAVTYQKAKYFNDRLTDSERIDYMKSYHSQIPPIVRQVEPLYVGKGEDGKPAVMGIVQFPDGWTLDPANDRDVDEIPEKKKAVVLPPTGAKYLRFKHDNWIIAADFSEEAWIAQEDLWIQNEIYRLVRVANDSVGTFEKLSADPKDKGAVRFKNPYFEMALRLKDPKTLELKVVNLLNRRQKLDAMKLRVRLRSADAVSDVVTISGNPLEPRGTAGKDTATLVLNLKGGPPRTGIFGLEQVLTWESAAVKRIDHIALASQASGDMSFSQRTMPLGLRPYIQVAVKAEEGGDKAAAPPGVPPAMDMKKMPFPMQGGGKPAAGAGELPNGFSAERYQEVTPQFRRVPVAVAMIVDQNHVDRVQTAFNNSKLRFLTTQVLLNHFPQSLRPSIPGEKATEGAPKANGFPPMAGFIPGMPGIPPGPMQGQAAPASAPSGDLEANMELVIYGVVTLYERYPPRPVTAAQAAPEAKAP